MEKIIKNEMGIKEIENAILELDMETTLFNCVDELVKIVKENGETPTIEYIRNEIESYVNEIYGYIKDDVEEEVKEALVNQAISNLLQSEVNCYNFNNL